MVLEGAQQVIGLIALYCSVLFPIKVWYAPDQPLLVDMKPEAAITLMASDFTGQPIETKAPVEFDAPRQVDLKSIFPQFSTPGTYLVYAVPKGKSMGDFVGTPLVVGVRDDKRRGAPAGAMVTRVEPLRYAVIHTEPGPVTVGFYYDVAPNTTDTFLSLASQGYFDGLTFHRIVPNFVIQGGDPRGDGTGGPGYQIDAEFNARPHLEGVLSMARSGDPAEPAAMPRSEFANSAGSQFFICLDYANTRQLDRRYTAFGRVTSGIEAVKKIGQTPIADPRTGRPRDVQKIVKVEVKPVRPGENPYSTLQSQLRDVEAAK